MLQHDHLLVDTAANAALAPVVASTSPPSVPLAPEPAGAAPPLDHVSDYAPAPLAAQPPGPDFYDALAPYGTWVDVGGYGRCWQPNVVAINPAWRPYCDRGHWVYTDCGWYWLSDYSWGWAPFHYGRWFRHNRIGWCWAPDQVWGPSWVSWRYTSDYCGWAPLPPVACFRPGLGFSYLGRSVGFSFNFGIAASCYTFVPVRNFCDYRLSRHVLGRHDVTRIFNNTTVVTKIVGDNHRVINRGIPADRVAAATHIHIRPVGLREVNEPGSQGFRAERLEAGGRTLAVPRPARPQQPRTPSPMVVAASGTEAAPQGIGEASSQLVSAPAQNPALNTLRATRGHAPERQLSSATTAARTTLEERKRTEIPAARPSTRRETDTPPAHIARSEPAPTSDATARTPVAARGRVAPLIIRGSDRAVQPTTSTVASRNHPSRAAMDQNPRLTATTPLPHAETRPSWGSPRTVQDPFATQRHQPANRQEPPRPEFANRSFATPSVSAPAPAPQQHTAPSHPARLETPHYTPAPAFASQPAYSGHEMSSVHQSHTSETRPAPSAPAPSPQASSSSRGNSSSDRRGR